jgi:glucose-6-phosphate 1-epimerase
VSVAVIYLQGATVTHFQKNGEPPLLFLSQCSRFAEGQAIRGGIPICFPWFGAREGKKQHGFARNTEWELRDVLSHGDGSVTVSFRLPEIAEAAEFPKFTLDYFVTVGKMLSLELLTTNHSNQNFEFENCLHTYFAVGDISAVSIHGLKGADYLDKTDNLARKTESGDAIRIASEVDRTFVNTTSEVEIHDAPSARKIIVAKENSASTVVWNPWITRAQQLSDFGDEEYKKMVCVESGNVSENKISLAPEKSSSLKVLLRT